MGQVENAEVWRLKYGNGSAETEVRKWDESHLLLFSALLTHDCVHVLRPCSRRMILSLQCESQILIELRDCSEHRYH